MVDEEEEEEEDEEGVCEGQRRVEFGDEGEQAKRADLAKHFELGRTVQVTMKIVH